MQEYFLLDGVFSTKYRLYLGILVRKRGNEEFADEEFLARKTAEETEELTSLKKAIF